MTRVNSRLAATTRTKNVRTIAVRPNLDDHALLRELAELDGYRDLAPYLLDTALRRRARALPHLVLVRELKTIAEKLSAIASTAPDAVDPELIARLERAIIETSLR